MQVRRGIRGVSLASLTVAKTPCFICFFCFCFLPFFLLIKKGRKKKRTWILVFSVKQFLASSKKLMMKNAEMSKATQEN